VLGTPTDAVPGIYCRAYPASVHALHIGIRTRDQSVQGILGLTDSTASFALPKPFSRSMGVRRILLLTLSATTPACSLFVLVPGVIQQAGTGAFLAMSAASLIALAMGFVYAELASAFPLAGGEYAMIGRTLGSGAGFIFMGMYTIAGMAAPTALALGASIYLEPIWPGARPVPVALAIVGIGTACAVLNVRLNAWVTGCFLVIESLALVVLTGLGVVHIRRPILELIHSPLVLDGGALRPATIGAIALATSIGVFAYNGFGMAVYFSEEMHEAPRRIAKAIFVALAVTVALEFVPLTAVLLGAPNVGRLLTSSSPFSLFVKETGGSWLNTAISLGIALAILNAQIALTLMGARFFYSTARDQVWQGVANRALVMIHRRFDSPWVATLLAGAIGSAACFVPFEALLVLTGTLLVVMYALLCIGAIVGRSTGRTAHSPYRMPLFPVAPLCGLFAFAYIFYANWRDPAVGRPSLIATAVMLLVASVYYQVIRRSRGRMVGPNEGRAEQP
jgi:amino acid transporter